MVSTDNRSTNSAASESRYETIITDLHITAHTASKIADIIELVCGPVSDADNTKSKALNLLLDDCCLECPIDHVVSYITCLGCDLLQLFVVHGLYEAVEHTLQLGYDVNLLARPCSSPLHLACKNGHTGITELFLRHGANVNITSTGCLTSTDLQHSQLGTPKTVQHCRGMPWVQCTAKKQNLINLALCSDNIDMIHVFMQDKYLKNLDTRMVLYDACQTEALRCLKFMVPLLPEEANQRYGLHEDSSLFSIAFAKSTSCGCVLLESNISWNEDIILHVNGWGESLLHLVLQYPNMPFFYSVVQATLEKYLTKAHINAIDFKGNSPLLVLLKMIGRQITLEYGQYEKAISKQMFDILKYLVKEGANVHIRNKAGKTVLHVLLHDDVQYYPTICVQSLPEISQVIEYLLQFDIDVNSHSRQATHPLVWAMKVLSSCSVYSLEAAWHPYADMVRLLLAHGADPNIEVEVGIHIINILLSTIGHWLKQCVDDGNLDCACSMLRHMTSMIQEFLQCGMHFSGDVLELCIKQIMILCNLSIPPVDQVKSDILLQEIGMILRLFFVHGIDPHQLKMVTEQQMDSAFCHLNALFYLARAFITHRQTGSMYQLLSIMESSLDQKHLNTLLTSICLVLTNNFNLDQDLAQCVYCIKDRQFNARPLQDLCRVILCKQLNWRLFDKVPLLKLPKALHQYLTFYVGD